MNEFYLTDNNRLDAVKEVLDYTRNDKEHNQGFLGIVHDICIKYIEYGYMSEKQEAIIARVYFIHCKES